jgi:hypothetical protein
MLLDNLGAATWLGTDLFADGLNGLRHVHVQH